MRKKIFAILTCCFMLFSIVPTQGFAAKKADHTVEYAQWGITNSNGIYYYQNTRIRIFMDMRTNDSFEFYSTDLKGKIDIKLLRDSSVTIKELKFIDKKQASEFLKDLGYDSKKNDSIDRSKSDIVTTEVSSKDKEKELTDITRYLISEAPKNVRKAIKSCESNKFYVIEGNNKKYVYYGNLKGDYAYQVKGNTLKIVNLGSKQGNYVLLSLPSNMEFNISLNNTLATFTKITI